MKLGGSAWKNVAANFKKPVLAPFSGSLGRLFCCVFLEDGPLKKRPNRPKIMELSIIERRQLWRLRVIKSTPVADSIQCTPKMVGFCCVHYVKQGSLTEIFKGWCVSRPSLAENQETRSNAWKMSTHQGKRCPVVVL